MDRFGLKHAHVVEGYSDAYLGHDRNLQNIVLDRMTRAGAIYFDSLMGSGPRARVVCVNWGYAMQLFVAHVLEMIGGKIGSMEGRMVDGTAFSGEVEAPTTTTPRGRRNGSRESLMDGKRPQRKPRWTHRAGASAVHQVS